MALIVTINDNSVDIEISDSDTVVSLIDKISKTALKQGELISRISIDGEASHNLPADKPISEIGRLDVVTIKNPLEEVIILFGKMGMYLESLSGGMGEMADNFRMGSSEEANSLLVQVVEGLSSFTSLLESAVLVARTDLASLIVDGESIKSREEKLFATLEDIRKGQENLDWVTVADLLEYELTPILEEWATILPSITRELQKSNN